MPLLTLLRQPLAASPLIPLLDHRVLSKELVLRATWLSMVAVTTLPCTATWLLRHIMPSTARMGIMPASLPGNEP